MNFPHDKYTSKFWHTVHGLYHRYPICCIFDFLRIYNTPKSGKDYNQKVDLFDNEDAANIGHHQCWDCTYKRALND